MACSMRPLCPLAVLVAMLIAPKLRAEPPPLAPRVSVRLTYIHGPGADPCEDAGGFTRQLEHYLGYDPVQSDAELLLTVMVTRDPDKARIFVSLHGKGGEQVWADRHDSKLTCDDALQSVALKGVMECERYLREHPPPPPEAPVLKAPEPAKPPEAPAPSTPQQATAPAQEKPPTPPRALTPALLPRVSPEISRRLSWEIGLGAEMALGLLPAQSLGGFAAFGLRGPRWSGAIEGYFMSAMQDIGSQGMLVRPLFTGARLAAPCLHWKAFFGCTVAEVGGYLIPSASVDANHAQASLAAFGLRAGGEASLAGPFMFRSFIEVAGVPVRPLTNVQQGGWPVPPAHASFAFTIQLRP